MSDNKKINELDIQTLAQFVSRMTFASALDNYKGARDINTALGYPTVINFQDYLNRYLRQDMARAIIDRPINATWRGGVNVNEEKIDTAFQKEWELLKRRHKLLSVFKRADRLSSLGDYAILLFGFNDVSRIEDMKKPVVGKRKLIYIKAKSQEDAKINSYDENNFSPRYGLPEFYDIRITIGDTQSTAVVHHSRVIHITGEGGLESLVFGEPRLECVYNRLMDLEKVVGGSSEMFWRGARPGFTGTVAEGANLSEAAKDALKTQLDEFDHNLRRFLINKGVKIEGLPQQIADPTGQVEVIMQMISAATGMPKRILTGSERGELASSQDKESWAEIIEERRTEFAEVQIIYPVLEKFIEYGVTPQPMEGWQIEWMNLYTPSEKEQAEIGKLKTETFSTYINTPGMDASLPMEMFLEKFLGWQKPDIDQLMEYVAQFDNLEDAFNDVEKIEVEKDEETELETEKQLAEIGRE